MTKKFLLRYYRSFTKLIKKPLCAIVAFIFTLSTKLSAAGNNIFIKSRNEFISFVSVVDNKNRMLIKYGERFVSGVHFKALSSRMIHIKCKVSEFGHRVIMTYCSSKSSVVRLLASAFSHIAYFKEGRVSTIKTSPIAMINSTISTVIKTIVVIHSQIRVKILDKAKVYLGTAKNIKFCITHYLYNITKMITGTVVHTVSKQTISSLYKRCKIITGTTTRAFSNSVVLSFITSIKNLKAGQAKSAFIRSIGAFSSNAKRLFGQTANSVKTQAVTISNLVLTKFISKETDKMLSSQTLIDELVLTAPKSSGLSLCVKVLESFNCKNILTSIAMLNKKIILSIEMKARSILTGEGCNHLIQNSNECVGVCSLSVSFTDWEYPYYDASGALVIKQVYSTDDTTANELTLY